MVTPPRKNSTDLRRAILLTTTSSAVVPAVGLMTQPILAQSLGVAGRGELAAAIAPSALVLGAATLGMPEALLYFTAKYPAVTRRAVAAAALITILVGLLCFAGIVAAIPILSGGENSLKIYILTAMIITVPALIVGVLRGAAMGRQMWREVAVERVSSALLRLCALGALYWAGHLTVLSAVVVTVGVPALCGAVYWRLAKKPEPNSWEQVLPGSITRNLTSYGSRVWLGAIAAVLLSRTDQLLMVPLSSVEQLGIYSVANVISDVPFLIVTAVSAALAGTNSRSGNAEQVAQTSRSIIVLGLLISAVLAAIIPTLLAILFGAGFQSAVIPTIVLLAAAVVYAPGFIASAGLGSFGRPGLRSIGFCISFAVNVGTFVAVVPAYGAVGACWASVGTALVFSSISIASASRVLEVPFRRFLVVTPDDIRRALSGATKVVSGLAIRRQNK